jgi:hypothetical protein
MATSGTTDFNLQIDDLIEEAFERCGMRMTAGYQLGVKPSSGHGQRVVSGDPPDHNRAAAGCVD